MVGNIPRNEYPRPQFVRDNWINLNGEWEFCIDNGKSGESRGLIKAEHLEDKIIVPFCPESKLSGLEHLDYIWACWYKKHFELPEDYLKPGKRVLLHIGACDYEANVYVNGEFTGRHFGGYVPITFDITKLLSNDKNIITVWVKDDVTSAGQPTGKQCNFSYYSAGCHYTRTTGIWQTVWLESVAEDYIKSVKMTPDVDNKCLMIEAETGNKKPMDITATVYYKSKELCSVKAVANWRSARFVIELPELHLWNMETPDLYDITFTFGNDTVKSYFGMRSISFRDGKTYLNGKSIFQRLILDQGYYPDGIYTAPTEEDLVMDIKRSMDMGYNGARLHQKVFEPRFLYHCDLLGYIVWDEHANWGMINTGTLPYEAFMPEWLEIIKRDYNHPSIIGWCPLNETAGNINPRFVKYLFDATMAFDNTRIFIDNSGWHHIEGCFDMYDVHDYLGDPTAFRDKYMALAKGEDVEVTIVWGGTPSKSQTGFRNDVSFVSEFGGVAMPKESNDENSWGYGETPKSVQAFIDRYKGLVDALLDNPKISAFCYTQLTDVEQEQNGLYYYDRRPKVDPKIIHDITARKAAVED